jgi:HK97 family phage portal protein
MIDDIKNAITAIKSEMPNILFSATPKRNTWQKKAYLSEGYKKNAVVFKCVNEIANSAASVKVFVTKNDDPVSNVDLEKILGRPNQRQNWPAFVREMVTYQKIYGDAFVIRFPATGKPVEIYNLSPELIQIEVAKNGDIKSYSMGEGQNKKVYPVDPRTGDCQILHVSLPNPDFGSPFGQSPLEAAAIVVDLHNDGMIWNQSLLKNSGAPSGILNLPGKPDDQAISRIAEFFKKAFTGSRNAGKVPVLTDGASFMAISQTMKDMDFSNSIKHAMKLIASVYGVPLPLVDNDASSYNNMEQAKEKLWVDTVLPCLDQVLSELNRWLLPLFAPDLELKYDMDSIPALEGMRQKRYDKMTKAFQAGIVTLNQARVELGYELVDDPMMDIHFIPSSIIPLDAAGLEPLPSDETAKADMKSRMTALGYTETEILQALG